jgi:hypothetical protein
MSARSQVPPFLFGILDISHGPLQTFPPSNVQTTTAILGLILGYLHAVSRCALADELDVVFWRLPLMLGRNANVLSRARWRPHGHVC